MRLMVSRPHSVIVSTCTEKLVPLRETPKSPCTHAGIDVLAVLFGCHVMAPVPVPHYR